MNPEATRSVALSAKLTPDEARLVRERALAAGLTTSAFMRGSSLGVPVRPPRLLVDPELVRQIIRVGVNLNQIARKLNAGHLVDGFSLRQCMVDTLVALDRVTERVAEEARR
ncbi:MAG: plasmid mobilization relaxosome protein MobC [Acidobacteriota bacterium]